MLEDIDTRVANLPHLDYSSRINTFQQALPQETIDCDILIIGTGAGGAACAYELTKDRNLKVVSLEAGPYLPLKRFNQNLPDMMTALAWDEANSGAQDGSLRMVQGRCVGGSTVLHMLTMTPLSDQVLSEFRALGFSEWSPDAMAPLIAELKQHMHISTLSRGRVNANAEPWVRGCDRLGYFWRMNQRNQGQCIGSGRCHTGCPFGGKISMDVSLIPKAINQGLQLYADAEVTELIGSDGKILGAKAMRRHPQDHRILGTLEVKAKKVVLAAGSLFTPYLLLRSGMQNPFGTVGSQLFVQPGVNVMARFPHEIKGWRGVTNPIHIDQWAHRAEGAFFIEPGMLDASFHADFIPGVGPKHAKHMAAFSHMSAAQILYCDRGNRAKVTLKQGRPDVLFEPNEDDFRVIKFAVKKAGEIMFAAGAEQFFVGQRHDLVFRQQKDLEQLDRLSWQKSDFHFETVHSHGSCPMSLRPETGVVDPLGQCHHIKDLYIADASTLPVPARANTTIPAATVGLFVGRKIRQKMTG